MEIGKISYSNKLKSLSWSNFKSFWYGREEERTGIAAEAAAKKLGIKVPEKKTKKGAK